MAWCSSSTRQHLWTRAHWATGRVSREQSHARLLAYISIGVTSVGPVGRRFLQASAHGATCAAVIVDPLTDEQARPAVGRWLGCLTTPSDRAHSFAPFPLSLLRAFVPLCSSRCSPPQLRPCPPQRSVALVWQVVRAHDRAGTAYCSGAPVEAVAHADFHPLHHASIVAERSHQTLSADRAGGERMRMSLAPVPSGSACADGCALPPK